MSERTDDLLYRSNLLFGFGHRFGRKDFEGLPEYAEGLEVCPVVLDTCTALSGHMSDSDAARYEMIAMSHWNDGVVPSDYDVERRCIEKHFGTGPQ